jgi:predicted  nucleic acid-binding Zn-ribbon protein
VDAHLFFVSSPVVQAAAEKMREADELAKKYWAARDEAKALEDHAKRVAAEANEEAKDARDKRVTVDRLGKRVEKAEAEAERALQKKAEMERRAVSIYIYIYIRLDYLAYA